MDLEHMACEPNVALLMTASGSLAHRKIVIGISSKTTARFIIQQKHT